MNFDTRGLKIMIVEHDRTILEIIQLRLDVAGYHSVMARTGQAAVEALSSFRPAALIVELNLPDMSGLQVLASLNRGSDQCAIPSLLMARQLGAGDVQRAVGLGARDCMTKPFSGAEIMTRIGRLLARATAPAAASVVRV
ncbi:response regulator [Caulobacter sp. KR2-114]|uniref:response regulator n=1 Tax=Caulobacter sp. KR2-114 TaxID=3400912 RepID=UPI003C117AC4